MNKLQVGDHVWSAYFNQVIKVSLIRSGDDWEFELSSGERFPADTPLSYFEDKRITQ